MLLARQTDVRATFFTAANFTLREGQHKVNEGSYLLANRQRRPRSTEVAPRNSLWPLVLALRAALNFRTRVPHKAIRGIYRLRQTRLRNAAVRRARKMMTVDGVAPVMFANERRYGHSFK